MKILIAEDSPTICAILQYTLTEAGYEVVIANNGVEAIKLTYKELPDIIVCDITMPIMSGYQVSRLLKQDDVTKSIPIIMMTSKQEESSKFWGITSGANEYITKPFEPSQLLELIEKLKKEHQLGEKIKKETKEVVDSTYIISRVNELLDRELFRSTLINEVANLTTYLLNLSQLIYSILNLFAKVVNYQIATLLILSEGYESLNTNVKGNISHSTFTEFKNRLLKETNLSTLDNIKQEIIGTLSEDKSIELKSFYSFTFEVGKEKIAIAAIGSAKEYAFPVEDINLLNYLKNQIAIIIDNAIMHKRKEDEAITDGLTKLATHRHFQESLDKELSRARRFKSTCSLLMIDIDNFKQLNDKYGHLEGDKVLYNIGRILKEQIRDTDTAARYGGEEFSIILSGTDKAGAKIVAERIRKKVEDYKFVLGDTVLSVTISLGISNFPEDAEIKPVLIRKADKALYEAKARGKNMVCVAGEEGIE